MLFFVSVFVCMSMLRAPCTHAQKSPLSTISVSEIRPGMRGYGLSVLRGRVPERFDVEVIDVLHNFRPNQDLILVKTPHPLLNRARGVGGMSGSPIYLDGRLAGAYAYGWPFGSDPVIGVTPIASMLAEIDRPVRPDSFPGATTTFSVSSVSSNTRASDRLPPYRGESTDPFHMVRLLAQQTSSTASSANASAAYRLVPAATPMMLGGFSDEVAAILARELEPLGLIPMQATGAAPRSVNAGARDDTNDDDDDSSSNDDAVLVAPRFVDGGAIGVQLVRGDISSTAIGTVTHVGDHGRLVAFGHPMLNAGEVGLPTATARVLHVLVSDMRSFKIAEAEAPFGALVHDRQAAIVVDTNVVPAMIPVRVTLHGIHAPKTEWNMEVATHRALTPLLVFSSLANAVAATASDRTDVVFSAKSNITLEGYDAIEVEDRGYMRTGPFDPQALMRLRLFPLMAAALGNPFKETRVTKIEVDLRFAFGRDVYTLIDASVDSQKVDPGSHVPVHLRFRRPDHPDITHTVRVHVPTSAAGEQLKLHLQPGTATHPERGRPQSLDDLLAAIVDGAYPATSLVAVLDMPSRGLQVQGHAVRALPGSALDALQLAGSTQTRPFVTHERQEIALGHVVSGKLQLTLNVRETARERH